MSKNTGPVFDQRAISLRLTATWLQTAFGIGLMGALVALALHVCGVHWGFGVAILSLFAILPIVSWWFSAPLIKRLTRCAPPDPTDPEHMRLVRVVDKLYPKTGLSVKPPVYVSPMPIANAFATGRSPKNAFIAATEGLFMVNMTDDELEAVVAHELAHVANRDTAITSMVAAMGSLFSLLLAAGLPWLFKEQFVSRSNAPLLNKLTRKVQRKQRFLVPAGGFFGFILMLVLFYIISIFTKFITLFVGRTRESAADAYAALWTKNPCALSTALQKLVLFEQQNGGNMRMMVLTRGLEPLLIVNAFGEDDFSPEKHDGSTTGSKMRRWWNRLGQNHPPVAERLVTLDKLSGGSCQRVSLSPSQDSQAHDDIH
ncbi:MAG TPA: M48 family metalloprotease [Planktothrix sp.]|jgi:heat shock protein HtpX